MPRHRRIIRPGELVHVISRFVNREHRLQDPAERERYRQRFGACIERSDWKWLSYAIMSSHVHHSVVAGHEPFEALIKRVHAPFARWLNDRQGRSGPLFADRPKTLVVHPAWAPRLIAYHHNNPPRAGVVPTADDSDWTSHQAYLDDSKCPGFLATDLGLRLMGFETSPAGRAAFARYVRERQDQPRDPQLTGDLRSASVALREDLGAAVLLTHPRTGPAGLDYEPSVLVERWSGHFQEVLDVVAAAHRVSRHEVTSASRRRDLVAARRAVVLVAGAIGWPSTRLGLQLGISETAVRKLRASATARDHAEAGQLVERLLRRAA